MNNKAAELRKRYHRSGYDSLTEHEKIMLLLSYSEDDEHLEASADKIYEVYGNIYNASNGDISLTMQECGINKQSAVLIKLIMALRQCSSLDALSKNKLDSAENAKAFFSAFLMGRSSEYAAAAAVDKNFNLIDKTVISYGGSNEVHIPIRAVVDFAVKSKSKYIFIAHCHPEWEAEPSVSDISTTKEIIEALASIKIELVDHIITGTNGAVSLRRLNGEIFPPLKKYEA